MTADIELMRIVASFKASPRSRRFHSLLVFTKSDQQPNFMSLLTLILVSLAMHVTWYYYEDSSIFNLCFYKKEELKLKLDASTRTILVTFCSEGYFKVYFLFEDYFGDYFQFGNYFQRK